MSNIEDTLAERGNNYREFSGHARITQAIKAALQDSPKYWLMSADKRAAVDMIAHKLGRIVNDNPEYKDSWTDIIGYARLVEKTLREPDSQKT